jgi:hypothetical protein
MFTAFALVLATAVASGAGPGGVPSSGNGEPCISSIPQGGETFLHDCATPTPAPLPSPTFPNPLATSQSQMSLGGDNEKNLNFTNDGLWMPAFYSIDNKGWNQAFDGDLILFVTGLTANAPHALWENLWVSSSTYSETNIGNGVVDRAIFFDQCESCFQHSGDPGNVTAVPGNNTCTLYWTADQRGEEGGYNIYYAATTGAKTINNPAGSVGTGVTTAVISGLSNGSVYYFYIDTVGISGTTLTGGTYSASTSPQTITLGGTNGYANVRPFTWLHIHDTVGGDEDVQVITCTFSAGFCTSGVSVVLTKSHSGGGSQTITSEWPYSGLDPLDSSTTTMSNVTGTYYGTRLGSAGDTSESLDAFPVSCKPVASNPGSTAPIISDIQITTSPIVYPTSGATPSSHSTVTFSGSIQETASSPVVQQTPSLAYEYNGSQGLGTSNITPTQTWSHAGLVSTFTWTLASPWPTFTSSPTTRNNGYVSVDVQISVPSPSPGVTTQWFQIGGKNNRQNLYNYAQENAYIRNTCSYQNAVATEWWMDYEIITNFNNPSPAPNLQRVIQVDEPVKGAQIPGDISPTLDTAWLPQNDQAFKCGYITASGWLALFITGTHTTGFGNFYNWKDAYIYESKDGYDANDGAPATGGASACTSCTWANMQFGGERLFDGYPVIGGIYNNNVEWIGQTLTALEDANRTMPILDYFGGDGSMSMTQRYYEESNCLLTTSYNASGQPLDFCTYDQMDYTHGDEPLYMNYYAPVGPPVVPIPSVPNPTSANVCTALSGICNATDQLMERQFLNGIVLLCGPPAAPTGFRSFPQTVYLLGNDSGPINSIGGAMPRTYTPITRWPTTGNCTNNSSAIIVYLPY